MHEYLNGAIRFSFSLQEENLRYYENKQWKKSLESKKYLNG